MRVRKREIAAQRADVAHTDVGHHALHFGKRRPAGLHQRRALNGPVRHGAADQQGSLVVCLEARHLLDVLHVHKVTVGGEAKLHEEQQLGAA